jgi:predicted nucleic acid-binding protein
LINLNELAVMNQEQRNNKQLFKGIQPEFIHYLMDAFRGQLDMLPRVLGIGRVNLVIDTNFIIEELSWLVRRRRNPSVPGRVAELYRTGLVKFFSPPRLVSEVEKHIPRLAREWEVVEEDLWTVWSELEQRIIFQEPSRAAKIINPERDPDDHDFIHLQHDLAGVPIITKDADIEAMGGNTLSSKYAIDLNIYLQDKRVEIAFLASGTAIVLLFGLGTWKAISSGIPFIIEALSHPVVLGILSVLLIAYIVSPRVREFTSELASSLYEVFADVISEAGKMAMEMGFESLNFRTLGDQKLIELSIQYPGAPLTEFAKTNKDEEL